jgi:hypothetical protein
MAATSAADALPQSIAHIGTPSNYQRHQGHCRVVQTHFAIDPMASSG